MSETRHHKQPKRGMIIASIRSGGTLLSSMLDSHPDVYCHRGEVLHRHNNLRTRVVSDKAAVEIAINMTGYQVSMCKLTWEQWLNAKSWRNYLGLHYVIFLTRKNVLRVIVSNLIRRQDKAHDLAPHTYTERSKRTVWVDNPIDEIEQRLKLESDAKASLKYMPYHEVSYEALTGDNSALVYDALLDYLEVDHLPLTSKLVKRNPYPLHELIENYDEVAKALSGTVYSWMLD